MKHQRFYKYILTVLLAFNLNTAHSEEAKINIAVLDLKPNNISNDTANIVRNRIEFSLFSKRKFNLLERSRIDIIRNERNLSGRDSGSAGYAYEAGKLLPADYVVTGDITLKDSVYVNIVLVNAFNGDILFSYNKKYVSDEELIADTENIASGISNEILYSREFDHFKDNNSEHSPFFINLGAGYTPYTGKLKDSSDNGFMFAVNTGVRDVFFGSLRLGIHAAYAHLYGKDDINYITLAPFQFTIAYEFQPVRKFFIIPGSGFGTTLVSVEKDQSVKRAYETSGLLFINMKYHFKSDLALVLFYNHYFIFECGGNIDLNNIGGGIETIF